jgi:hypothetical protein
VLTQPTTVVYVGGLGGMRSPQTVPAWEAELMIANGDWELSAGEELPAVIEQPVAPAEGG